MLRYEGILKFSLVPSIIFFLLSLAAVALTTTYWILGDWIVPRYISVVTTQFNDRTQQYVTDDTIVYFTNGDTDATIVSGCLNLTAAVLALIAWSSLRKPDMDSQLNTNKRRFWILSVVVVTVVGAIMALVAIILDYTKRGNDRWGCTSERLAMGGKMNTNLYCTREMAACNYQARFLTGKHRTNADIVCNCATATKWMQIILILVGLFTMTLFALQARIRRTTRSTQSKEVPTPPRAEVII
ncbi:hypothetical protein GMOD_00005163 [Pyrenophora seminiperda CCB06]|uniref:Uncharacterized protein n=1 Tax=Pyrenophora seminiperda CCB06 TaxID=1302712 RepID=A0A3M7LV41_9PLEO|nr:hypothetical protein GMOD_00005163 [Pyrenophora seminiperda CCB06]